MHLTDAQINEYLDHETNERAQIDSHLTVCADCAARLAAFQTLFAELDSLPELELTHSLRAASVWDAARVPSPLDLPAPLPRFITLAAALQAAIALIALVLAAPFVTNMLPVVEAPSFTDFALQAQTLVASLSDVVMQIQIPALPHIPAPEIPSLVLSLTLAGASLIWLVGNGLLLRKQIK